MAPFTDVLCGLFVAVLLFISSDANSISQTNSHPVDLLLLKTPADKYQLYVPFDDSLRKRFNGSPSTASFWLQSPSFTENICGSPTSDPNVKGILSSTDSRPNEITLLLEEASIERLFPQKNGFVWLCAASTIAQKSPTDAGDMRGSRLSFPVARVFSSAAESDPTSVILMRKGPPRRAFAQQLDDAPLAMVIVGAVFAGFVILFIVWWSVYRLKKASSGAIDDPAKQIVVGATGPGAHLIKQEPPLDSEEAAEVGRKKSMMPATSRTTARGTMTARSMKEIETYRKIDRPQFSPNHWEDSFGVPTFDPPAPPRAEVLLHDIPLISVPHETKSALATSRNDSMNTTLTRPDKVKIPRPFPPPRPVDIDLRLAPKDRVIPFKVLCKFQRIREQAMLQARLPAKVKALLGGGSAVSGTVITLNPDTAEGVPVGPAEPSPFAECSINPTGPNLLMNPSAQKPVGVGWRARCGDWVQGSVLIHNRCPPHSNFFHFYPGASPIAELVQEVNVETFPMGTVFVLEAWCSSFSNELKHCCQFLVEFVREGRAVEAFDTGRLFPGGDWKLVSRIMMKPMGTSIARVWLMAYSDPGDEHAEIYFDNIFFGPREPSQPQLEGGTAMLEGGATLVQQEPKSWLGASVVHPAAEAVAKSLFPATPEIVLWGENGLGGANLVKNPRAADYIHHGWNIVVGDWEQGNARKTGTAVPHTGLYHFFAGHCSRGEILQDIAVDDIREGALMKFEVYACILNDTDVAQVVLTVHEKDMGLLPLYQYDSGPQQPFWDWRCIGDSFALPARAAVVRIRLIAIRYSHRLANGACFDTVYFGTVRASESPARPLSPTKLPSSLNSTFQKSATMTMTSTISSLMSSIKKSGPPLPAAAGGTSMPVTAFEADTSYRLLYSGNGPNLLANPNADLHVSVGWTIKSGHWGQCNSERGNGIVPKWGAYHFSAGPCALGEIYQDVDISSYSAGTGFVFKCFAASKHGTDLVQVVVEYRSFRDAIVTSYDSGQIPAEPQWRVLADERAKPLGVTRARIRLITRRTMGTENCGFFDAVYFGPAESTFVGHIPRAGSSAQEESINMVRNPRAEFPPSEFWRIKSGQWGYGGWDVVSSSDNLELPELARFGRRMFYARAPIAQPKTEADNNIKSPATEPEDASVSPRSPEALITTTAEMHQDCSIDPKYTPEVLFYAECRCGSNDSFGELVLEFRDPEGNVIVKTSNESDGDGEVGETSTLWTTFMKTYRVPAACQIVRVRLLSHATEVENPESMIGVCFTNIYLGPPSGFASVVFARTPGDDTVKGSHQRGTDQAVGGVGVTGGSRGMGMVGGGSMSPQRSPYTSGPSGGRPQATSPYAPPGGAKSYMPGGGVAGGWGAGGGRVPVGGGVGGARAGGQAGGAVGGRGVGGWAGSPGLPPTGGRGSPKMGPGAVPGRPPSGLAKPGSRASTPGEKVLTSVFGYRHTSSREKDKSLGADGSRPAAGRGARAGGASKSPAGGGPADAAFPPAPEGATSGDVNNDVVPIVSWESNLMAADYSKGGKLPPSWTVCSGQWAVVRDRGAKGEFNIVAAAEETMAAAFQTMDVSLHDAPEGTAFQYRVMAKAADEAVLKEGQEPVVAVVLEWFDSGGRRLEAITSGMVPVSTSWSLVAHTAPIPLDAVQFRAWLISYAVDFEQGVFFTTPYYGTEVATAEDLGATATVEFVPMGHGDYDALEAMITSNDAALAATMQADLDTRNLLVNPYAADPIEQGWSLVKGQWVQANEETLGTMPPHRGKFHFFAGMCAYGECYQDVSLAHVPDNKTMEFRGWMASYDDGDDPQIMIEYRSASGVVLDTYNSGKHQGVIRQWHESVDFRPKPRGCVTARVRLMTWRTTGLANDGYFDDLFFGMAR